MSVDYIKIIGLVGSLLLCFCGLPEVWKAFKNKNANGLTTLFVVLWALGEVFTLTYVIIEHPKDIPLLLNYIFSGIVISIIFFYKFKEKTICLIKKIIKKK